jgi:endonuclease/exonuclease/phosphatase family metal-dependent hydrolase
MNPRRLRVMTFNIHHCRGTDGIVKMDRIAKLIEGVSPDFVGLNEIDRSFHTRTEYADQLQYFSEHLGMEAAFVPSMDSDQGEAHPEKGYGSAILSRYSLVETNSVRLKAGGRAKEPRVLLHGKVDMGEGKLVHLWVSHLSLNPWHHRSQTKEILQRSLAEEGPALIMGDWNMRPGSRPWKRIQEAGYRDVWHELVDGGSVGATFPSSRPWLRLDYIFASSHFNLLHAEVVHQDPVASDHLPVWADLGLQ